MGMEHGSTAGLWSISSALIMNSILVWLTRRWMASMLYVISRITVDGWRASFFQDEAKSEGAREIDRGELN